MSKHRVSIGAHYSEPGAKLILEYNWPAYRRCYIQLDFPGWVLTVWLYSPLRTRYFVYDSHHWVFNSTLRVGLGFVAFEFIRRR